MRKQTRALFLDRDGVINVDTHFLYRSEDCEFMPGILELAAAAHRQGYLVIVATNQSGIGRGLFTEQQFLSLMEWIKDRFAEAGGPIAEIYYCPFHPEEGKGEYRRPSLDRKPAPGMFLKARDTFNIDMKNSIAIGDSARDAEAAFAAGVGTILHLGPKPLPPQAKPIASLHEAQSLLKP